MKRKSALPELLAPAGSEAALIAAIAGGADAVYLGMNEGASNARTLAENFSREQLLRLIPIAHAHGVKIYVTLNTMTYENELAAIVELAGFLAEAGADGVIVADLGLASLLHQAVPALPLHASTQAFAHSTRSADALARLGFSRVVLARELSEKDIRTVTERSLAETEIFLHGALCVSHSGECLFSSLVGGRSGNRGACAQPCRLPYNGAYPLSLKDYSLARHIPALIESGVASLKIEGRMKTPAYVFGVTRIFRRLLDEGRAATDAEMQTLERIFSRSGFTDGYFTGKLTDMGGIRRTADKEASKEENGAPSALPALPVKGHAFLRADEPSVFTLTFSTKDGKEICVSATGTSPSYAQKAAMTRENVNERLSKLGGTGFYLSTLSLTLDEGLFLPVSVLNALRRDAVCSLLSRLREREASGDSPVDPTSTPPEAACKKHLRTALFYRADTFAAVPKDAFDVCFLSYLASLERKESDPLPDGIALPPVLFDSEEEAVKKHLCACRTLGVRYALVSSIGAISLAKECGLIPIGDHRLNVANRESARILRALGLCHLLASAECTPAQARAFDGAVISYGRIPLMLTERCFVKETVGCKKCGNASLCDRKGVAFPVLREFAHRALVVNSLPTYLADTTLLDRPVSTHMIFTTETPKEAIAVLRAYRARASLGIPVRRAFKP